MCQEGYSSSLSVAWLRDLGMRRVADVAGGFDAWRDAGRLVTARSGHAIVRLRDGRVLVAGGAIGGGEQATATTETWGGGSRVCNSFRYQFSSVSLATRPDGGWQLLRRHYTFQDPGYRIRRIASATFIAGRV